MFRVYYTFVIYDEKEEAVTYSEKSYYELDTDEMPTGEQCRKEVVRLATKHLDKKEFTISHANYYRLEEIKK